MGGVRGFIASILVLPALYCLYATLSFHALQVISTPEQLPRVRYNRNFWFVLFVVAVSLMILVLKLRKAKNPDR
jgi:hypothetical protein